MTKTFKVFAALLTYPTAEIQEAIDDFLPILEAESLISARHRKQLKNLITEYRERDLLDLQERYVLLFDRTRSLSLHLFEHVHGESRDRGQAMVDLKSMYEESGLLLDTTELPDFLPLFLEYLSILPRDKALELLSEPAHVIAAIRERLVKRDSSYAAVLDALGSLTGPADEKVTAAILQEPDDDPEDLAALDAAWEAEQVEFGPGSAGEGGDGCPQVSGMMDALNEARNAGPLKSRPLKSQMPKSDITTNEGGRS